MYHKYLDSIAFSCEAALAEQHPRSRRDQLSADAKKERVIGLLRYFPRDLLRRVVLLAGSENGLPFKPGTLLPLSYGEESIVHTLKDNDGIVVKRLHARGKEVDTLPRCQSGYERFRKYFGDQVPHTNFLVAGGRFPGISQTLYALQERIEGSDLFDSLDTVRPEAPE